MLLIGLPGIKRQQPPFIGRERLGRLGIGEHGLDRPAAGHAELQYGHDLRRVDLARQPGDFAAIGIEEHHRGVAIDLEPLAKFLRAGPVTVDMHGHKGAGLGGEILAVEERALELIARRAPGGAPVQEQRFLVAPGLRKSTLDIGIGCGRYPGHIGRRRAGSRVAAQGQQQRQCGCGAP